MQLELFTLKTSPYGKKVELMLEMKGLEFERIYPERDWVRKGGYAEINPIRKLPALLVDGEPLPEAEVICEFIEDMWPEPALLPAAPKDRARARLLSRIADIYVMSPIIDMLNNASGTGSEDIADNARVKLARGLVWLEHWIEPGPYALGEQRTVADCAVPPVLYFIKTIFPLLGVGPCPEFGPETTRYYEAIQVDEDVRRAFGRMDEGRRSMPQKTVSEGPKS